MALTNAPVFRLIAEIFGVFLGGRSRGSRQRHGGPESNSFVTMKMSRVIFPILSLMAATGLVQAQGSACYKIILKDGDPDPSTGSIFNAFFTEVGINRQGRVIFGGSVDPIPPSINNG